MAKSIITQDGHIVNYSNIVFIYFLIRPSCRFYYSIFLVWLQCVFPNKFVVIHIISFIRPIYTEKEYSPASWLPGCIRLSNSLRIGELGGII